MTPPTPDFRTHRTIHTGPPLGNQIGPQTDFAPRETRPTEPRMLTRGPHEAEKTEDTRPTPTPQSDRQRLRPPPRPHDSARGSRRRHARPPFSPASITFRPPPALCAPPASPRTPHHRILMRRPHAAGPLGPHQVTARRLQPMRILTRRRAHCATPGRSGDIHEGRTPRSRAPRPRPPTSGEDRSPEERLEEAVELRLGDDPHLDRLGRSRWARCRRRVGPQRVERSGGARTR